MPDPDTRPLAAPPRRVSLTAALFALLAGFILAQLAGKLVGDVARAVTHARSPLSAGVVVPSMLASELALLLVALVVPLSAALPLRQALALEPARAEVFVALEPARAEVFVAAGIGTVMLGPLGDFLMGVLSRLLPDFTLGVVPTLHELAQRLPAAWLWPTFALLPGLAEELLFRGVLQGAVRGRVASILVSGGAFALFHADPVHIVGVLPLGLFLAWAAARSSTLVTIFAHVLNNTLALVAIQSESLDVGYGSERPMPTTWLIFSLVLFAASAVWIARLTPAPAADGGSDQGTG
jgi:membrane protease YdiL (CAAX protease family)